MKKQTLLLILLFIIQPVLAQKKLSDSNKNYNLENLVAIHGYDPVTYFTQNKAVEGTNKIALNYKGVIYYFSSNINKEIFEKNPENYLPQYGGWCAYAMGDTGKEVDIDPKTFKIVNGKLYLFYNTYFKNTLKLWNKGENRLKHQADKNWIKLNNKKNEF